MSVDRSSTATKDGQRRANLRLALVLASIALVFFVGFIAKNVFFGR